MRFSQEDFANKFKKLYRVNVSNACYIDFFLEFCTSLILAAINHFQGSFRYECCKLSSFGGAAREAFKDGIAKRAVRVKRASQFSIVFSSSLLVFANAPQGVGFRDVLIERVSLVDSEGATASRRCLQAGLCPFIFI